MTESEILMILFGTGMIMLFLLIVLLVIFAFNIPNNSRARRRSVRDDVRKIKEQIENPEED